MHLLRAVERVAVPWKNGGGVTREVAAFPAGAGMADFGWRISIADVTEAGPFSRFEGVDRILTVLQGQLSLSFGGGRVETLDPGQPFAFPGDSAVEGAPIDGPVRDLNVMVRRGAWRAHVEPWRPGSGDGGLRIAIATAPSRTLDLHDAVLLDPLETPPDDFVGYLIRLDRC